MKETVQYSNYCNKEVQMVPDRAVQEVRGSAMKVPADNLQFQQMQVILFSKTIQVTNKRQYSLNYCY